ncbi:PHYTOLONGIN PHYL1.2 [Salix koriyanagi]|uniref:PHYTOLONGIN PHYL1.2 n=1 Tax=Salix koriyanagi TaxID=2511006 RepID=A0A9Q1A4M7_9ROSI|nr:PHYTOLONGIN PHYL1.2 [Salix koriyanagi]
MHNTVHYCCIAKGNRTLYVYSGADHAIENVAALCLERPPSYHKWYFETTAKKTFGFFIEDGFVYFTIVDEGLGNPGVLQFLEHVRDEFKKSMSPAMVGLVRVLHLTPYASLHHLLMLNGQIEVVNSTKAPLLGKSNKQDKRKSKDHVISIRDIELEEHRKSTDRGAKLDSAALDSTNQAGAGSSISLQKDLGSMRIRTSSQSIRKKWWRQVRIVLAIDVAICVILFVIWLSICGGFGCTH